ncbi:unnamed protein product, partial [Trichobilharzia szidati]
MDSPVDSSTPKSSTKRAINDLQLPLAGGSNCIKKKKTATVPEQLNISNRSSPVDLDSNVSSSRRSVLKKLSQPKKTATARQGTDWMYVNHEDTPQLSDRPVPRRRDDGGEPSYQRSTNLLIRKMPFCQYIRYIIATSLDQRYLTFHWQAICFLALQEAAEAFLVSLFESAQQCEIHARLVTGMPRDIRFYIPIGPSDQQLQQLTTMTTSSRPMLTAAPGPSNSTHRNNNNDNN